MANLSWEENCGLLGYHAACSGNNPEERSSHLLHGRSLKSRHIFMFLEKYYADMKTFNSLPLSLIHVMNKKARFKVALIRYLTVHSLYYGDNLHHLKTLLSAVYNECGMTFEYRAWNTYKVCIYAEGLHYVDICLERKISLKQTSKSLQVLLQICNHTHAILLLLFYFIFVTNLLPKYRTCLEHQQQQMLLVFLLLSWTHLPALLLIVLRLHIFHIYHVG